MKSKNPSTRKRVKRYGRKISKAELIAQEHNIKYTNQSLNPDELLRESISPEELREIIDNEENFFPDSTLDLI